MKKEFFITIDGIEIAVSEEVYRAYKRPLWAERKRKERDKRCRVENYQRCTKDCRTCAQDRNGSVLSLDDEIDETEFDFTDTGASVEEIVMDKLMSEILMTALEKLTEDEQYIIRAMFYEEKTEREVAAFLGVSQPAIHYRSLNILKKLKKFIE